MEPGGKADGWVDSRALTGLRAVAALMVMSHHLYLKVALHEHLPFLQWGLRKGYLGVDLFFVLSGFVISMAYGAWFDGSRPVGADGYLRFLLRRVARLWPLHVMVTSLIVIAGWQPAYLQLTFRMLFANFSMTQAWGYTSEINPPAWSVSTEFLAYLLFPVLAQFALRGRFRVLLAVLGIVVALALCMALAPPLGVMRRGRLDVYYNYSLLPALRCLAGFTLGMLAWRASRIPRLRRIASLPWLGPAALAAMVVMMLGRVNDLLIYLILPVIVLGMHLGRGPVQRALGRTPFHELGQLSYALYLIHFTLLTLFPFDDYPMRYMLPLYLATAVALSAFAYLAIEQPGRRLVRALGEAVLSRRPGAVPPTA